MLMGFVTGRGYDNWQGNRAFVGFWGLLEVLVMVAMWVGILALVASFVVGAFEKKTPKPKPQPAPQHQPGFPQGQYAAPDAQYAAQAPGVPGHPSPYGQPPQDQAGYAPPAPPASAAPQAPGTPPAPPAPPAQQPGGYPPPQAWGR